MVSPLAIASTGASRMMNSSDLMICEGATPSAAAAAGTVGVSTCHRHELGGDAVMYDVLRQRWF